MRARSRWACWSRRSSTARVPSSRRWSPPAMTTARSTSNATTRPLCRAYRENGCSRSRFLARWLRRSDARRKSASRASMPSSTPSSRRSPPAQCSPSSLPSSRPWRLPRCEDCGPTSRPSWRHSVQTVATARSSRVRTSRQCFHASWLALRPLAKKGSCRARAGFVPGSYWARAGLTTSQLHLLAVPSEAALMRALLRAWVYRRSCARTVINVAELDSGMSVDGGQRGWARNTSRGHVRYVLERWVLIGDACG
mmetsp:Transcript_28430/g.61122  ORF Transcript_28430/g.61122 Transcript_28430/m.61122 type:complete len:253 (+) Transcript_28430:394-1152(+)